MDIQKLRRAAKREYDRLVNDGPDGAWLEIGGYARHCHPSHVAAQALETVAKRYSFGFGVEGACDQSRVSGAEINYINTGNPYEATVIVTTQPGAWWGGGVTFRVGCWGDFAKNPRTARKYGLDR